MKISCFASFFLVFCVISENTFWNKGHTSPTIHSDACSNTKKSRPMETSINNQLSLPGAGRKERQSYPFGNETIYCKLQMGRFFSVISPNTIYTYFLFLKNIVGIVTDFAMSFQSLSTSTHQQKINPRNKWPRLSLDCSAWISMDPPSVRIGWPPPLPQCSWIRSVSCPVTVTTRIIHHIFSRVSLYIYI